MSSLLIENVVAGSEVVFHSDHSFREVMRLGFPGMDNLRYHSDYVLSYDKRNRTAHWVVEHLTRENLRRGDDVKRGDSTFREDTTVSEAL